MKEFDKIIGYGEVKSELYRICDMMREPKKYKKLGVKLPGGILLYGDPGIGKTSMAKCFISACGRRVIVCRKDKPNGDFVNEIKMVFEKAKTEAPCIVFLDDMDKFSNEDEYHRNAEELVTVQSCMDDVKDYEVFVLATANDLDCLPSSLLRAGRFDKTIRMRNPVGKDAEDIVRYYLEQKQYVAEIDAKEIARILDGRSCAELETVINEAGIYAGFQGKEKIDMDDIIKSCMRIIFKAPEKTDNVDDKYTEITAYHEAGHAVISEILEPESVNLVSVRRHGGEIGGITSIYRDENRLHTKSFMENRVIMLLGGKAATEIRYGTVDVGANSDLRKAFDIVIRFIDDYCSYGFDKFEFQPNSSDRLLDRKESFVISEMERFYNRAKQILIENRNFLDSLAAALVEKKTVIGKDVRKLKKSA